MEKHGEGMMKQGNLEKLKGEEHPLDSIIFWGHKNILGHHRNSIEVTREKEITKRADCIIGVNASKACSDLNPALKDHIRKGGFMKFEIDVNGECYSFVGQGKADLELSDITE